MFGKRTIHSTLPGSPFLIFFLPFLFDLPWALVVVMMSHLGLSHHSLFLSTVTRYTSLYRLLSSAKGDQRWEKSRHMGINIMFLQCSCSIIIKKCCVSQTSKYNIVRCFGQFLLKLVLTKINSQKYSWQEHTNITVTDI